MKTEMEIDALTRLLPREKFMPSWEIPELMKGCKIIYKRRTATINALPASEQYELIFGIDYRGQLVVAYEGEIIGKGKFTNCFLHCLDSLKKRIVKIENSESRHFIDEVNCKRMGNCIFQILSYKRKIEDLFKNDSETNDN